MNMFIKKVISLLFLFTTITLLISCSNPTVIMGINDDAKNQIQIPLNTIETGGKKYLVTIIDPTKLKLRIIKNEVENSKSIKTVHQENGSFVSFNGSFFDPKFTPLGLLYSDNKILAEQSKSSLMNSVFIISNDNTPQIISYDQFTRNREQIFDNNYFAIQSGPLLFADNEVLADPENKIEAGRTAIGITNDHKIIVILLRQSLLERDNAQTLHQFSTTILNEENFKKYAIKSLLNLDGGNSSGLAIGNQYYPELEMVENIIITNENTK